jgi:hypothetical protein
MQNAPEVTAPIGLGAVFTLLFVTLGPLKIAVLGVLQVALAVEMILRGLSGLGVLRG